MFESIIPGGLWGVAGILFLLLILTQAIVFIRQTERGLIERFGKYNRFAEPGLNLMIPFIERVEIINITETMVNADKQEIITEDSLNATVDAQIYYRIKPDEISVRASEYNVNNVDQQIVALARTTLRNIIGTLTLRQANSERNKINKDLLDTLAKETRAWGIDIVRTELKEIDPPKDVQDTMNKVVKAQNEKIAAVDFATATETQADGEKRASIKRAEGLRQAKILEAEGQAEAIRMVNKAADETFVNNAQLLRKLETVERSLATNAKIVVPVDTQLINIIGDLAGVPLVVKEGTK